MGRTLLGQHQSHIAIKMLWKSSCQPKHNVFFWLLLKDILRTRNIMRRKNMFLESYSCVLYQNDVEETQNHLFLNCPFAIACWGLLSVDFTPTKIIPRYDGNVKDQIHTTFFMMAIFTMCWTIWGA
jgi:hypothetical protein